MNTLDAELRKKLEYVLPEYLHGPTDDRKITIAMNRAIDSAIYELMKYVTSRQTYKANGETIYTFNFDKEQP